MRMYIFKFLLISSFIFIISCNSDKKVLDEDYINLSPDKNLIKKGYYRYSTLNPFHTSDSLFTPIGPRKTNSNMGKTLIQGNNKSDLRSFNKYVENNLGGKYTSYIYEDEAPLFRSFLKVYKNNEPQIFSSRKEIEAYFNKNNIDHTFIENTSENLIIYRIQEKNKRKQVFCVIQSEKKKLSIFITYNVKDTIRVLPVEALRPFLGDKLEN